MDMNCLMKQFNYVKVVIAVCLQIWSGVIIPDKPPPCCIVKNHEAANEKAVMDPAHGWMKVKSGYALQLLIEDINEKQVRPGVDSRAPPVYKDMVKTFNEWLTKRVDANELGGNDLGAQTQAQDESVVTNQLEQLVDRVAGVLHYAEQGKREALIEKFISDVRSRV
jgi:hypothetical protein